MLKKKLGQISKTYRTFYPLSSQKYGAVIRDAGPENNLFWVLDPDLGVKKAPDPDPQH